MIADVQDDKGGAPWPAWADKASLLMKQNYDQIVLQYQARENAAQMAWIRKATEVHDLRNTINWSGDQEFQRSFLEELRTAEKAATALLRDYYLAQIETAKSARNTLFLEFGQDNP